MLKDVAAAMPLPLLGLVGWSVVPDFATKHLLSYLHRFSVISIPTSQSNYRKQYALTFAFVVLSYLSYNLFESARSMPPNFYQILSVEPTVDEQGLKTAFRQFAKKNHPDKPEIGRDGEEIFVMVRDVYEALKNPVVRFAYDRFGPDVLTWSQTCTTTREYIQRGLLQSSGYHIFVAAALVFWSLFSSSNGPNPVSFWRYTLYLTLFVAEISLILSPSPRTATDPSSALSGLSTTYTTRTLLHTLFPQRLIHQHILFLHQLFVFLSIALSRVVPVLLSSFFQNSLPPAKIQELIQQIAALASGADRETSIILNTFLHSIASPSSTTDSSPSPLAPPHEDISSLVRYRSFHLPPEIYNFPDPRISPAVPDSTRRSKHSDNALHPLLQLKHEVEELIVEANLKREDGPLRSVWETAVLRGRALVVASSTPTMKEDQVEKIDPPRNFWEAPVDNGDEGAGDDTLDGHATPTDTRKDVVIAPDLQAPASPRRNDGARGSH